MRVLVIGAGVIGQVYAGRLAAAGQDVTVLARGDRARTLREHGIQMTTRAGTQTHRVVVATTAPPSGDYDWTIVACRFDQLDSVLPIAMAVRARQVVTLCNVPEGTDRLLAQAGSGRVVLGFPGIGGGIDAGVVHYTEVRQQRTTIGTAGGAERPLADALRAAGFPVALVDDMPAWLTTHAIFIAGVGAAILLHGGDSGALGRDRAATMRMVRAVGEGFSALRHQGVRPVPAPLRTIFTTVPRAFAVPYWQRQLRGPTGTETIARHVRATRHSELPALAAAVRDMVGPSAPHLDALLHDAGL